MHDDFFDLESLQEGYDIEFKKALGRDGRGTLPNSVWETYSAMANTEGGFIILGVEEKQNNLIFHDLPEYNKIIKDIWNILNNKNKVSANLLQSRDIGPFKLDNNKTGVVIHVLQASRKERPVYIGSNPLDGTYLRKNEGDYKCPHELVKQMLGEQANDTQDAVILEHFDFKDIDNESFRIYRQQFSNRKPDHPFNECDDIEFLRHLGGWAKDRHTGKEGLTLAGLLMFGKFRSILDEVPNYIVDYQEREDSEARWIDRVTNDGSWSGNLYDFYRLVIKKLTTGLKVPFKLQGDKRIEDTPVHESLREALVNTIIHADYSGNCSILIVKRPDLFGFRNPGLMRIPKIEAIRGGVSDCRNRNLQKMFQLIGLGEQAGSGFPKIYRNWRLQHWREPELEVRVESNQTVFIMKMISLLPEDAIEELKVVFGDSFNELKDVEKVALVTAFCEGCVNHSRMKEVTKEHPHDITVSLHDMVEKGFLVSEGMGRGTFYYLPGRHPMKNEMFGAGGVGPLQGSRALRLDRGGLDRGGFNITGFDRPIHSGHSSEHLNNSSEHLDTLIPIAEPVRSMKKAPRELMESTILQLCQGRYLTLEDLSSILHRDKDSLRIHYISPMLKEGKIEQMYKNVTTHPNQKYRTVEK
ncbi:putative transcriptional regulator [Methanolacinia petrolearia DSM 11571]|uniref:Putative transcriptional regulator n=1 Tax=Methanolacinia petrolearia (strain DSM 11571 / OCM 486 / SEBR 4847) TaxID=679926 RepID=E1RG04_METP4|nr:RNA-binding domain-containing protein [Methanolacinia petrolearia]ADN36239.1 putative transcriptional regulator [Methanolacinia petrolearia DSM 11571]